MRKIKLLRILLVVFIFSINSQVKGQWCNPTGPPIFSVISTTVNFGPWPPQIGYYGFEICGTGYLIDTTTCTASKTYFIQPGGKLLIRAQNNNTNLYIRSMGSATIISGGNFINLTYESGASITGTTATTYTCASMSFINGSCSPTGILNELSLSDEIQIFPSPAKNAITVLNINSTKSIQFTLFNLSGQKVLEKMFSQENNQIDISGFPSGLYNFVITNNSGQLKKGKLLVE